MICNFVGCSVEINDETSVWGYCAPHFAAVMDAEDSEIPDD